MRYKLKKYNWWIYCVIIAIAVFLILYYCYPDTDQDNARYILSAISQGLAAILALVFTITLVVSQMTRRYTAMDKIIFRRETIFLMIVFGIGVVTPLLVLKFGFWGQSVNLSIAVAVFCVFSLLPFLKGVNRVLKYEFGVNALYREIMVAIESGIGESFDTGELTEIGERAVMEAPENTVVTIIRGLSQIGKKCAEKGLGDKTYWIVYKLSDIGVKSVGKGFEEASFFAVKGLKDV
jgi:MFS family permease